MAIKWIRLKHNVRAISRSKKKGGMTVLLWLMHKQKPDVKYRMHTFVYNLRVKACTVYAYWTDVWEPVCEFS